jgi:RNA polymerase primary sigma factor
MSNEQLVTRIKAGVDVAENMERLYFQVKGFIHSIAWGYRGFGEIEDLEQEGYLALYPAIDGYDPERDIKFVTYAEPWIRQRIQRYIQNNGSCLRLSVHRLERRYRRFVSAYAAEYGQEPSEIEAAANLNITREQIRDIRKDAYRVRLGSLDSPVTGLDGEEDGTVGDMVASGEDLEGDALERMECEELRRELWSCVDSLPGRQSEVLRMRYQKDMTLGAIGQEYDTTPEAVRQIHAKALRELRKPRHSKRLKPFLPEADRIYSAALMGNGVSRFNTTWTSSTERVALKRLGDRGRLRSPVRWTDRTKENQIRSYGE